MPTPSPDKPLHFAHYRVESGPDGQPLELGRGAMGVTYKAFDERLRVEVALKVIAPGQVDDAKAQALFLREARAAAQVHHAHVAGVVFLNDIPGDFFYAMEFVEGETVEAFVRRRGPLPVRLALRIVAQAAQGLAAGNERGLIHRDIKPANLMLAHSPEPAAESEEDDGLLVKVIDFGLSKSLHTDDAGGAISLTGHGPIGTPNYMSPEQISPTGDPLDARTDIYSLGATLWYLLMGRPPFDGTQFQVLSQQMQSPPPWEKLEAAGVPPDVEALLKTMLAKRPDDRPANYPALISALKRILRAGTSNGALAIPVTPASASAQSDATITSADFARPPTRVSAPGTSRLGVAAIAALALLAAGVAWQIIRMREQKATVAPPEKSVAVLPFENLSSDQENAFFTNGMQDEILTNLSRVADLKVISRSSVQQYKSGVARNLKEIGQALGVTYILEGSVQRAGGKVRVNAQLIDTRTDGHVWANRYDRDLADVFGIQSEVAENIATQLKARLSDSEKAAIAERPTSDITAYDLYLRARQLMDESYVSVNGLPESQQAIRYLSDAVGRDPTFLAAWCALAEIHDSVYWSGYDRTPARLTQAKVAIDAAVKLRPNAGETHLAQARHAYWGYRDYARAREHLAIAGRLLPNSWEVPHLTGLIDRRQGEWEASNRNLERAIVLNPRSLNVLFELYNSYGLQRKFDLATRVATQIEKIGPTDINLQTLLPQIDVDRDGKTAPLHARLDELRRRGPDAARDVALNAMILGLGERDFESARQSMLLLPTSNVPGQANEIFPRAYFAGLIAKLSGKPEEAKEQFAVARNEAAALVAAQPKDAQARSALSLIAAEQGDRDNAIREARQAVELLPLSMDAYDGSTMRMYLAMVAANVDETDLAFAELKELVKIPSYVNYGQLSLDPRWDPIRNDPRFEALVASLAPAKK